MINFILFELRPSFNTLDAEGTDVPQGLPLRGVRKSKRENDRVVLVYVVDSLSAIVIETKNAEVKLRSFVLQAGVVSARERQ